MRGFRVWEEDLAKNRIGQITGHPDTATAREGWMAGEDVRVLVLLGIFERVREGIWVDSGYVMSSSSAAITREFRFSWSQFEHEGLVDAIGWVGSWVVAEFDDCIAPGTGAEDVAYVGNGVAEGVTEFGFLEVIADSATGPDGLFVEEGLDEGDCFLDLGVEG